MAVEDLGSKPMIKANIGTKIPPFQFPIWQLTNKEIKSQAITKDQKNEMKAKSIEF